MGYIDVSSLYPRVSKQVHKFNTKTILNSFYGRLANKRKHEVKNMETKSRYEVISDLEQNKRTLITERDGLDRDLKNKEKLVKESKRDLEDLEQDVKDFKDEMKHKTETYNELIRSVDDSLNRFEKLHGRGK